MEMTNVKQEVMPSHVVYALTRKEACEAAFAFAKGRKPSEKEILRLAAYVRDRGAFDDWRLVFSIADDPEKGGPDG